VSQTPQGIQGIKLYILLDDMKPHINIVDWIQYWDSFDIGLYIRLLELKKDFGTDIADDITEQ